MAEIKDTQSAASAKTWQKDEVSTKIPTNLAADIGEEVEGDETDFRATVDAAVACAIDAAGDAYTHRATASVKIDEVFSHITAFRAIVDNGIPETSLLGRSLRAQANAIFNQAFFNLQARLGFAEIYIDTPGNVERQGKLDDITEVVVHEVLRLQRILK